MFEMIYKNFERLSFVLVVFTLASLFITNSVIADGLEMQLTISYVNGFKDIADKYADNWEQERLNEGYTFAHADTTTWPVGLSFQPYYQWDNGFRFGAGLGPMMLIWGDAEHFQLPLNLNAGYTFNLHGTTSLYVFGGPSYHYASGDYVDGSNIGFVGGVGIQLVKGTNNALGIQATYDSAEVDIDDIRTGGTVGIKAAEFSVGLFVTFK